MIREPGFAAWQRPAQSLDPLWCHRTTKGFTQYRAVSHYGMLIIRLRRPNRHKIHQRIMKRCGGFPTRNGRVYWWSRGILRARCVRESRRAEPLFRCPRFEVHYGGPPSRAVERQPRASRPAGEPRRLLAPGDGQQTTACQGSHNERLFQTLWQTLDASNARGATHGQQQEAQGAGMRTPQPR